MMPDRTYVGSSPSAVPGAAATILSTESPRRFSLTSRSPLPNPPSARPADSRPPATVPVAAAVPTAGSKTTTPAQPMPPSIRPGASERLLTSTLARTIARMPAFRASGSVGHASSRAARSESSSGGTVHHGVHRASDESANSPSELPLSLSDGGLIIRWSQVRVLLGPVVPTRCNSLQRGATKCSRSCFPRCFPHFLAPFTRDQRTSPCVQRGAGRGDEMSSRAARNGKTVAKLQRGPIPAAPLLNHALPGGALGLLDLTPSGATPVFNTRPTRDCPDWRQQRCST